MTITTLSMVLTVFVLNIHHVTEKPVPPVINKLLLCYVARCLGMRNLSKPEKANDKKVKKDGLLRYNVRDIEGEDKESMIELCPLSSSNTPNSIRRKTSASFTKYKDDLQEDDFSKEWKQVAEVCDRLFFWFFFFAILITTLVLFHPLTHSSGVENIL